MKKKRVIIALSLLLAFGLTACGSAGNTSSASAPATIENESSQVSEVSSIESAALDEVPTTNNAPVAPEYTAAVPESATTTLVVYFSMPETANPSNMTEEEDNSVVVIDGQVLGNTQYVAEVIRENTDADIFRIEPVAPYPTDHDTLVDFAAEEQRQSARPAINGNVENIARYDTIFLGYPNWWGDLPMILYTFLEEYDLSGKTVIPFNTHGGSGFSNTIATIAELQPGAHVEENGYTVSRNNVQEAEPEIIAWLSELGYTVNSATTEAESTTRVSIEIDGSILYAQLDDSALAREFAASLPQTVTMQRVGGGREFYGDLASPLSHDVSDSQTTFDNGDLAYWYSGNGLCFLYNNQVAEPEIASGIIVFGRITSDLSAFHEMGDSITASISLAE